MNQIRKDRVFSLLDRIEDRTNKMVHEITELSDKLKAWQDFKVTDTQFIETLNKYIDTLNK